MNPKITNTQRGLLLLEQKKRRQESRRKFFGYLAAFTEAVSMYLLTAVGILLSKYVPIAKKALILGRSIDKVEIQIPTSVEFFLACVLALLVTLAIGRTGSEIKGMTLKWKILIHLGSGITCYTLIGS